MLGHTRSMLSKHLQQLVKDVLDSGININVTKSTLVACQRLQHLVFTLDSGGGCGPHKKSEFGNKGDEKVARVTIMIVSAESRRVGRCN